MERSRVAFDSVVMRVYLGCVEHPVWMGPRVGRENVCVFVCVVSGPEICADILGKRIPRDGCFDVTWKWGRVI